MLNKAILMGRLTADPELKKTSNDIATVSFKLAVERNFTPKGQEKQADFINIVAWRHTAEFVAKYFTKGQLVCIEGSIQTRNYKNKEDVTVYVTEVIAEQVYFAEKKIATVQNTSNIVSTDIGDFEEITTADDENLPF
jgi:single-strand DNA-binding protein